MSRIPKIEIPDLKSGRAEIEIGTLVRLARCASDAYQRDAETLADAVTLAKDGLAIVKHFVDMANEAEMIAKFFENAESMRVITERVGDAYPVDYVSAVVVYARDENTCPRCDGGIPNDAQRGEYMGATSRRDNTTELCSACGNAEAVEDFSKSNRTLVAINGEVL